MKKVINCLKDSNPLINKKLREVSVEEGNKIATELFQILNQRKDGIGLAANQVGIDAQVAVVNVRKPLVLINPKVISKENKIRYYEGCLSFPKKGVHTERYETIEISTEQEESNLVFSGAGDGKYKDLLTLEAVCIQHEIDHLNGLVCMDRKIETSYKRAEPKIGRNDKVTIRKGDETKVLKYKKIENYINQGWELEWMD